MADRTITIEFQEACAAAGGGAEIRLELDEVANDGKTSFSPGEEAFIRVIRSPQNSYSMLSNGTVTKVGSNVPLDVEDEEVAFDYSKEESLQYIPIPSTFSGVNWYATSPGLSPGLNGDLLQTSSEIVGIGTVDYTTLFDKWKVTTSVGGKIIVVALMGDVKASLIIDFGGESEEVELDFIVEDYCSGEVVQGAQVHIDGIFKGLTNVYGLVNIGKYLRGSTHTVKIIKSGYTDSNLDNLRNDEFTVPES